MQLITKTWFILIGAIALHGGVCVHAQTLNVDLDRTQPGVQDTFRVAAGEESWVRGAITVSGSETDTVGIYALEIEVISASRTGPLYDCSKVAIASGDLSEPSSSDAGTCDSSTQPNRFGRRSLFAEETALGADGILQVFLFDLPVVCQEGEVLSLRFRTTATDPQIGIRINGEAKTLGEGLSSDVPFFGATVSGASVSNLTPTPTPETVTETPTATPTPSPSPTSGVPSATPQLVIDLDRSTPEVETVLEWVEEEGARIEGAVVVLGEPDWTAGAYAIEVVVTNGETTQTVIDCEASDFYQGDVTDAGGALVGEVCTSRSFSRTSLFAGQAEVGEDGRVEVFRFDLDIRCDPDDRIDFSFTSSERNSLLGIDVNGKSYTIGDDSKQPIDSAGAVLICVIPTPTPTFTPTPTATATPTPTFTPTSTPTDPPTPTPVPTLREEDLLSIIEGVRSGTRTPFDLFLGSLGWLD